MTTEDNIFDHSIGVITEIVNDKHLIFVVNNNIKCHIEEIVATITERGEIILAQIGEISVEFYLENSRQYIVSKAADDSIDMLGNSSSKPRYGQRVKAKILGYYARGDNSELKELDSTIDRYTPSIFQKIYSVNFQYLHKVYGLSTFSHGLPSLPIKENVWLGSLVFPRPERSEDLYFDTSAFKRHTLITGITGSGKSRLAALLIRELASAGGHISLLDPHDEYANLLLNWPSFSVYKFSSSRKFVNDINRFKISFSEKHITPQSLSKLMPGLTASQEILIYEIFDKIEDDKFSLNKFFEKAIEELVIEIRKSHPNSLAKLTDIQRESDRDSRSKTEFISKFVSKAKTQLIDFDRNSKMGVIMPVLSKISELADNHLINQMDPNWLRYSPASVDIFDIDYSSNTHVRRFIDSIIQYFFRKESIDPLRIILIDEVHMLLNENSATSKLLQQLLREGRKFNISVIFVSQNLSDIPKEIQSQFHNFFCFRETELETKYFPDQVCKVSLCNSKSSFSMRVRDVAGASPNLVKGAESSSAENLRVS